jgi:hypothetical protein
MMPILTTQCFCRGETYRAEVNTEYRIIRIYKRKNEEWLFLGERQWRCESIDLRMRGLPDPARSELEMRASRMILGHF